MRVKRVIVAFLFFLFFVCKSYNSSASHVYGGDLLYRHISGNLYQVTLTLYGDCSSGVSATLPTSKPQVFVYNGTSYHSLLELKVQEPDSGLEVSPVCPQQLHNTTCKGGTLPGVKKFVYLDTVELPAASASWRFIFAGQLTASAAGRSQNITNVFNAGTTLTYLEATLNNLSGPNSSPEYTSIPTPFYCMDPDQQYNQGAVDHDGDSLAYDLVHALNGKTASPLSSEEVSYNPPFSGEQPVSTDSGEMVFSKLNGQLTFTPDRVQNALVVCRVYEYKNGVLVGTSQREMTFIVSPDCEGTPPTFRVVNVNGGAVTGKNVINICVGTPTLSFDISVANPDKDTTYITPRNVPGTSVLTINNNNSPSPSINFSWKTDTLKYGVYTFFLDVKNNHCPIANRQTIAYTINVTPYPTVAVTPLHPTGCVHQAYMQYDLALGYIPRMVTIRSGTNIVATYKDTTGVVRDSLPVGNYEIIASCSPLCTVSEYFAIVDSGKLPLPVVKEVYCQRDSAVPIAFPSPGEGAIIVWYDGDGNVLPEPPTPTTDVPGTYKWIIVGQYKVCISDESEVEAVVHPLPIPKILTRPATICFGDTLLLEASGGVKYTWTPGDRIFLVGDQSYTRLTGPAQFNLKAESDQGCIDSTSVYYNKIEPCCIFMYPSAFTPNSDGKNDGFRVGTPGNMRGYKLSVYNRWGQLVFLCFDPKTSWDGTKNGIPCETGTYFYFFEGMCATGIVEKHQGDLTLIR